MLDLDAERAGVQVGREQKVWRAEEVVRSRVDALAVSRHDAPSDPDPVGAQGQPAITIETLDVGRWFREHALTVHGAGGAGYWTLVYDIRADEALPALEVAMADSIRRPELALRLQSAMAATYLVVAVIGIVVAVFALQNGTPATVRFIVWNLEGVPLAGLILGAFVAGLVIAGVPLGIQRWRSRSHAQRLEARVRDLEGMTVQRNTPPATPPGAAP
jgi:uncharacterized integral membrane protein